MSNGGARPKLTRRAWVVATLILLIGITSWLPLAFWLHRPLPGDFVDDGYYFVSAQAIRDGQGYRLISRPAEATAAKYPIGLSAVTAASMWAFSPSPSLPTDLRAARVVTASSAVVLTLASFVWFGQMALSPVPAAVLALAVLWHPGVTTHVLPLLADVPYAAVSLVLLVRWTARARRQTPIRPVAFLLDGLLAGFATLLRTNGVTLIAGALIAAGLYRSRRSALAACGLGILVPIAGGWLFEAWTDLPTSGAYASEMVRAYHAPSQFIRIPFNNVVSIGVLLTDMIFPPVARARVLVEAFGVAWPLRVMLYVIVASMVVWGVGLLMRGASRLSRPMLPVWTHLILTLGVFAVWWYSTDLRLILLLLPIAQLAFVVAAGQWAGRLFRPDPKGILQGLTTCLLLGAGLFVVLRLAYAAVPHDGRIGEVEPVRRALIEFARHTDSNAVIASPLPELLYLQTGRQGFPSLQIDADGVSAQAASGVAAAYRAARGEWLAWTGDRPLYVFVEGGDLRTGADPAGGLVEVYETPDASARIYRLTP